MAKSQNRIYCKPYNGAISSVTGQRNQTPSPDGHDGRSSGSQEGRHFENGDSSACFHGKTRCCVD
uniref:Cilia and flagella associated protein 43 n=1 Tax=Molossus molossus TaxID=27622 RepID=A0A7J8DN15_MOLMO|nr:cilia and flagella associated protein 43 [Molossus molossus]